MGLRILHAISSVNPKGGGPIEGVIRLAAENRSDGHQVEVFSLDDPADPWVAACPVRCHAMGPGRLGKYAYAPRLVPWLRRHREEHDVVIVNGLWQYISFGVWRALAGTATPYLAFSHGMLDPWFRRTYPLKHLKKCLYWPWAEYRVLRDARAVLFTCEQERLLARGSFVPYRCRERVVNYGTMEPPGDAPRQREAFLARFPHLRGRRILLFLGRVHVKKGPDLLLRGFAGALRSLPAAATSGVEVVMAGPCDDAYGASIVRLAEELGLAARVTWTGMITGELKWGAFRCAEAFILPSHQENFGIAVVEAMACGVPVLISDQVNIWREIEDDGAGCVEPDTVAGTQRLIERWLRTEPSAWAARAAKGVASFHRRFHVRRTADALLEAIHELAVPEAGVRS